MLINYIEDLNNFIKDSKVILCDLWGVIHNGKEVFSDSRVFLEYMNCLLYTSPSPRD